MARLRLMSAAIMAAMAATCGAGSPARAATAGLQDLSAMKYGMIVHYVPGLTTTSSGTVVADINTLAANFDATGFANDLASFGIEYVIFTAWHKGMYPLYPSQNMSNYRGSGSSSNRDLLADMITAVKAKGIKVLFYTHPRDGHDFPTDADKTATGWGAGTGTIGGAPNFVNFDFGKWNTFVDSQYRELLSRYASDIDGLFIDEGSSAGDSQTVVDYPALRATVKAANGDLAMIQNFYGNTYTSDYGAKEYYRQGEMASNDGNTWPAFARRSISAEFSDNWWASRAQGSYAPYFTPEAMFRYTVLQAGANTAGGGINWAAGPYSGGGWEDGVVTVMKAVGGYIAPVAASIKHTYPSTSYVTSDGATINSLTWGVATKSTDNSIEYIHVLKPPGGSSLQLPAPADGKTFTSATLLSNGHAVGLTQTAAGVTLTLGSDTWSATDTVIRLSVQAPSKLPGAPGTWVSCGAEGATCAFSGTRMVAYGAGGVYAYRQLTSSASCGNGVFGDPSPGVVKACYYREAAGGAVPAGATYCADEGQICAYPGAGLVTYGAGSNTTSKSAPGQINCSLDAFSDPAQGVIKSCSVQITPARYFKIRNATDGKYLSGGGSYDGAPVTETSNASQTNTDWTLTPTDSGFWKITNRVSGRVLNGGGNSDGYAVTEWSDVTSSNLQWRVVDLGGGKYKIQNRTDRKVLNGGGNTEGYAASEWSDVPSTNLQWTLPTS